MIPEPFMSSSRRGIPGCQRGMISLDLLFSLVLFSGIILAVTGMVRRVNTMCNELSKNAVHMRDEIWVVSRWERMGRSIQPGYVPGNDPHRQTSHVLQGFSVGGVSLEPDLIRLPQGTLVTFKRDSLESMTIIARVPSTRRWWR